MWRAIGKEFLLKDPLSIIPPGVKAETLRGLGGSVPSSSFRGDGWWKIGHKGEGIMKNKEVRRRGRGTLGRHKTPKRPWDPFSGSALGRILRVDLERAPPPGGWRSERARA